MPQLNAYCKTYKHLVYSTIADYNGKHHNTYFSMSISINVSSYVKIYVLCDSEEVIVYLKG